VLRSENLKVRYYLKRPRLALEDKKMDASEVDYGVGT
jgi:hypothetical protein